MEWEGEASVAGWKHMRRFDGTVVAWCNARQPHRLHDGDRRVSMRGRTGCGRAHTHTHTHGAKGGKAGWYVDFSYQQPKNKTRPAHPTRSQLPSIDDVSARQRQELIHSFTSVSSTLTKSSTNRVLFSSSLFPLFFFFGDLSITIGSTHFLIFD